MENYVILEQIGEGSFGKVYKARRKNTGFIVAMKFITKHNKNPKDIKNLRQEIGILQKLNHEHIILMFDAFENDREFCVVTEYAQGELFNILEDDKKLSEATVQLVAKQLIKALYYLHSNRIIHRDMKPQNILIGPNGTLKLCDFGFARAMSSNTVVLTSIKGTPLYMSPELVREQPYDETSDLWSLGVILYELFVGQPPFYTNSIYSLINLIVKDPVKYPSDMKMSPNFKSFLQGLLQKNPAKRLTWPNLLYHPFIYDGPELVDGIEPKETKAAKEKREKETASLLTTQQKDLENSILNSGMGGPRVRLERLLLPDAGNMFGSTQVVSNLGGNCGPKDLPHVLNRIQVSERLDALADELLMEYVTTHPKTPTPLTREPVPASVNASAAVAIELNHKDSEDTESDYWENKAVQRNGHLGGSISAATGGGSVNSTPLRSTTAPSNSTRNTPIQSTHKSVSGRVPITAAVAEAKEVPRAHAVENTGHKSPSARQNEKRSDYQIENKTGSSSSPRSEAAASSQFSSPSKSRQHLDANNADAKITKTNHTHYHVNSGAVHGKSKETKLTGWEEESKTNSPLVGNEPAEDTPALDTTQSSVAMLPEEEEPLEVSEMIEDQCDPPEHRLYMGSGHYTANAHVQSKSSYGNGDTDVSVVEEKLEYQAVHEDNHHHNGSKPNTSGSNKDAGFYFDGEGDVEVEEDMKSDYVSIQSQVPTEAAVAVTQSKALERKQVGDRVTSNQNQNAMSNPNPGQSFLSQHLKYWLDLESVVITQNQSNSEVESSSAIEDFDIALTFLTSDRFQLELQTIVDFDGSPETGGVTGYPEYEPAMDYDWVSLVYIAIRIMKYGLNACVLYIRHIYNTYLLNKTDQMPANCLVTCCKCFVVYNQLCSRVTYWSALSSNGINILSKHNIIDGDTSQRNTNPIQQSRPSTAGSSVVKFGSPSPRRKEPNPKSISTGLGEPKVGIGNQSICDVWVVVLTTISDLLSDILIINQASPQLPIYCDDLSGDTNESLSGGGIGMVDSTNIFKAVLDAVRMEQQAIAKYLHTSTASLAVIANSYSSLLLQSLQEYSTLVLLDAPARVGAASNASSIGITLTTLNQCVWKLVCPILEGNIGSVPGSVRSNSQSQHSIQSAQMSPGVPGLGLGFSGLNLSDRWSIVNMLIQILKYGVARIQEGQSMLYMSDGNDSVTVNTNLMASSNSQSSDMSKHSSHVNILVLFKQAFQTLNGLIHLSASSNEIHSMLIAQHIPTLLCDWIHVVQTDSGDKVFSTLSSCAMHSLSMLLYITTIYDKHPSSKCSLYSAYPASRGKTPLEHVLQRPPEGRAPPSNVVPASNTTDSITSYKEYTNNKIKTLVTVASYLFSNDALKARILMLLLKSMLCQCQVVGDTLRSTDGMDVLTEHQYEMQCHRNGDDASHMTSRPYSLLCVLLRVFVVISELDTFSEQYFIRSHVSDVYHSIAHGLWDCSLYGTNARVPGTGSGVNILTWCRGFISGATTESRQEIYVVRALRETAQSLSLRLMHNIYGTYPACMDGLKQDSIIFCHTHGVQTSDAAQLRRLPYSQAMEKLVQSACGVIISYESNGRADTSVVTMALMLLTHLLQTWYANIVHSVGGRDYSSTVLAAIHLALVNCLVMGEVMLNSQMNAVVRNILKGRGHATTPPNRENSLLLGLAYGYQGAVSALHAALDYVATATYLIQSRYRVAGNDSNVEQDAGSWLVNQLPSESLESKQNSTRRSRLLPIYLSHKGGASLNAFPSICDQIQHAGTSKGELNSRGMIAAMYYIRTYVQYLASEAVELSLPELSLSCLELINKEGVIGVVSLACLPQHLDACYIEDVINASIESPRMHPGHSLHSINKRETEVETEQSFFYYSKGIHTLVECVVYSSGCVIKSVLDTITILQQTCARPSPGIDPAKLKMLEKAIHPCVHTIYEDILKTQLVRCILEALRSYNATALSNDILHPHAHCVSTSLEANATTAESTFSLLVNIFCELVLTSNKFLEQFVEAHGIRILDEIGVFTAPSPIQGSSSSTTAASLTLTTTHIEVLIYSLQIVSQIGRNNENHFNRLLNLFKNPHKLSWLLSYEMSRKYPMVTSKACNFIGNLCRHSDIFYLTLILPLNKANSNTLWNYTPNPKYVFKHLLHMLLYCCCSHCEHENSNSVSIRKFACFAVGNAAFYSNALYDSMLSLQLPTRTTHDSVNGFDTSPFYGLYECLLIQPQQKHPHFNIENEKMRSNAAGAIGNLVRNGMKLCDELIRIQIPQQLIRMTLNEHSVSPQRIALFSLGTMVMYSSCRDVVTNSNPSIETLVNTLQGNVTDETVNKYLTRLKQKLKMVPIDLQKPKEKPDKTGKSDKDKATSNISVLEQNPSPIKKYR